MAVPTPAVVPIGLFTPGHAADENIAGDPAEIGAILPMLGLGLPVTPRWTTRAR